MYMLEKSVTLYRTQFDGLMTEIYGDYRLNRHSMEMDAIIFRVRYMSKHKKDLDKIPDLKEEFIDNAIGMRKCFSDFILEFLCKSVKIQAPFKMDDITDIIARDVKLSPDYVTLEMCIISENKEFLQYIDDSIPEDKAYNMFPNQYFRFFTDSYNDGIAKAYPELFEKRKQDDVGVGDDADIFVHNLTMQLLEYCSLQCLDGYTKVKMFDLSEKCIKDIEVGDVVLGFDQNNPNANKLRKSKVLKTFKHQMAHDESLYEITVPFGSIRITGNHPIVVFRNGEYIWKKVEDIDIEDDIVSANNTILTDYSIKKLEYHDEVYNLETETGTYMAEGFRLHNCTYCYQFNKMPTRMTFDIAKEFIDNLLEDKYGYINRYNSPALILEFIGGEPLLEIKQIRRIYEYFLDRCYELNHPWFTMHRLSICSNGLQYFNEDVQNFFRDYYTQISFNISIDGNRELHDSCRIQPNGEGSYDIDMAALAHYNKHYSKERNSKMTLAPNNIKYLFESVKDFIDKGTTVININCVFEEGWNQETAKIEYEQLKKLATYLLDNDLEHLYIAIFNERQENVNDKYSDSNFCGSTGSMLAVRPNGQFYPCIRYMPTSVGNGVPDLSLGTVQDGMIGRADNSEVLKLLDNVTRRSQTNDICYECPISNDCAGCNGLSLSLFGTPNKRATFICIQMIAESLANYYFWNLMCIKHPEYNLEVRKNNVPDEWTLLVIDREELNYLQYIELAAMCTKIDEEAGN